MGNQAFSTFRRKQLVAFLHLLGAGAGGKVKDFGAGVHNIAGGRGAALGTFSGRGRENVIMKEHKAARRPNQQHDTQKGKRFFHGASP